MSRCVLNSSTYVLKSVRNYERDLLMFTCLLILIYFLYVLAHKKKLSCELLCTATLSIPKRHTTPFKIAVRGICWRKCVLSSHSWLKVGSIISPQAPGTNTVLPDWVFPNPERWPTASTCQVESDHISGFFPLSKFIFFFLDIGLTRETNLGLV